MAPSTPPVKGPATLPARPTFSHYGDTAQSWPSILAFYDDLANADPAFDDVAKLAKAIADSLFPAAGLCALTSHSDLILGPSTRVLDNPHLIVAYDFQNRCFRLEYRDGSAEPWVRTASPSEAFAVIERFLTRRARWFTDHRRANQ